MCQEEQTQKKVIEMITNRKESVNKRGEMVTGYFEQNVNNFS